MRNNRIIIGNVAASLSPNQQSPARHVVAHFINLSNIPNILPYAQGSGLSRTYSNVAYHSCRFMLGHSLGRIGMCMEEHACEAILPHINGNVASK